MSTAAMRTIPRRRCHFGRKQPRLCGGAPRAKNQESAIYARTRRGIPTLSATLLQAATSSSPMQSTTENQHSMPFFLARRAKSRIAVYPASPNMDRQIG